MTSYRITAPNRQMASQIQEKIDNLTKPKGSLGRLEELALQICLIQQTLTPSLTHPRHVLFAADHGIAQEGVSLSPQEVTRQMIFNFLDGGAGINFMARQHGFKMKVVDAGVNFDFEPHPQIIDRKIRKSTRNYLIEAAMTPDELEKALNTGAEVVKQCNDEGCNIISFGEMGIGNTSASALWLSLFTGTDLKQCIGAGSDHTGNIISHKYDVLSRSLSNYNGDTSALSVMQYFGGYEMVMAVGGMLKAAELNMVILVDGFIMTACVLAASRLYPEVLDYCVFGHQGDEAGHQLMLLKLGARPLLNLGMRLGEGTGALCAYPIVETAVRMINEMNSFKKIEVTKYFD